MLPRIQTTRSIEAWDECSSRLTECADRLKKYQTDGIKLKYSQAKALENEYQDLVRELPTHCPHDMVRIYRGTYIDVGYGCDRYYTHYDLKCERCKILLFDNTHDTNRRSITDNLSLLDGIMELKKHENVSDEELRRYGIYIQTYTHHTTKVFLNGIEQSMTDGQ